MNKIYSLHMGPAQCAVDLSVGSERGLYVNQDYILHKLKRPHRAINLMYCYYPNDEGWPIRASIAHASDKVNFAWDYPYDDYFPYLGGLHGDKKQEPFLFMKDIRKHGQDIILTITIDPKLEDSHLIAIAKDLTTYGRMMIRINHEATGNWFSFTKRASYQEIADFYIRFHRIIKEFAPNVSTILCIGGIEYLEKVEMEKENEFTKAVQETDIWSVDKYMALHWGWPYDIAEKGGKSHKRDSVEKTYELTKRSYQRFLHLNHGIKKPMFLSEFNSDGDVTGPYEQADMIREYSNLLKQDPDNWFSGFTFYQFRDDGRLGLEITDPNNKDVGIEQPALKVYRDIIHEDFFSPSLTLGNEVSLPLNLRWGSSEDSDGISIPIHLDSNPIFFELYFQDDLKDLNLIFSIHQHHFYKAPGVTVIDLMSAFFDKPISTPCDMDLHLFAPPSTGENVQSDRSDWNINYYTPLTQLPRIRIRYSPIEE